MRSSWSNNGNPNKISKGVLLLMMWTIASSSCLAEGVHRCDRVGILVAMNKEYELLKDYFGDDSVEVRLCGIGKVNAAVSCVEMIRERKPDVIISVGCAGGNGNDIHVGDVVVSAETTYHDVYCGEGNAYGQVQGMPERYASPQWLVEAACKTDSNIKEGLIVSGDWFVGTKEKMKEIVVHFPDAKAVDMESAAIAQVCYIYNVPSVSVRIISDRPIDGDNASQYEGFWNTASEKTFSFIKRYVKQLLNQK